MKTKQDESTARQPCIPEPYTLKPVVSGLHPLDSEIVSTFQTDERTVHKPIQASPLTVSPATERQLRLQAMGEQNLSQLASLQSRIQSQEWVSLAEYNALKEEMARLRAENDWLRSAQQSDWALGLSDELPPPYQSASPSEA
jgi:hypothetical protein